ncbi:polyribonucleotide nucleotidyltransferase [Metallumcola ferriviriculae]|uniref:Polyribonucleotide nucleotidyltransferase n=1 Tax=Metallumcola ferriviriculae TaxID=3039180 RepID=A0AAU0UMB9_9FIRM|nr:polyribonucleotide nucleotidyltransferase [Desulfitibacteraceae bacterium MK1]
MQVNNEGLVKALTVGGRELTIETGRVAQQASGSVIVRYGDTVVLVTATGSQAPRQGMSFFPLTVDYEERMYSVGKIPGGFIKREGRPSEKATLTARLIDRPIRPLFPKHYRNDVQVVATVMSVDQDNAPDIAAMVGASAALTLSHIPFEGPIAAVEVGLVDGELVVNPNLKEGEVSKLRLVVAGTEHGVMMVEARAKEVSEETVLAAIERGHEEIKKIVRFISEFREEALTQGIAKEKQVFEYEGLPEHLSEEIASKCSAPLNDMIEACFSLKKHKREEKMAEVKGSLKEKLLEEYAEAMEEFSDFESKLSDIIGSKEKHLLRETGIKEGKRIDGRSLDEVRPIWCEVGVLPRTHGSGLFTRGETQVINIATLGAISDEQMIDGLGVEESKRYMHHYNFPPYSVGEARPMRGPGRREIGHGALAEKALEAVLPSEEEFPYTIRLVSEVVSSNGSTSMASVCSSTLSLMDSGVPIKAPVAGVAMGLMKEEDQVAVLTDIQGIEDALGDMDFKVAGTRDGITALQMDIKVAGINIPILKQALAQAKDGRMFILNKMVETIAAPREQLSPYAPSIIRMHIHPDKIRDVIGPGGKTIKKIVEETDVKIDIEDDGSVFIAAIDREAGANATKIIEAITQEVEVGKIYLGKVTKVMDFGAFVEVLPGVLGMPGKEGMVHISQLAPERVEKVEDIVSEGETITVKAISFDHQGRLKLSRKEALPGYEGKNSGDQGNRRRNDRGRNNRNN